MYTLQKGDTMIDSMQLSSIMMNYARYTEQKTSGREQINAFRDDLESKSVTSADAVKITEIENVSLESILKAKYPNLVYNVGDGTSSAWRTRNDYPFEALFQEGEKGVQQIENWKPIGTNPKNQRYLAIAPNSKAVMIHPKAQERMEKDPEFAKEVMERIESWWEYDVARNEAITPECTVGMSQAIAIGEDGEIANVISCGGEETIHINKQKPENRNEDEYDWWTERMARHDMFMQLWLEGKTNIDMSRFILMRGSSGGSLGGFSMNGMLAMQSGQSAERKIHSMIKKGLKEKLGDTVCGISTDEVINATWSEIEKGRSMGMSLMI